MNVPLRDRFRGCLMGLAIGDALGARFEAQSSSSIRARAPDVNALLSYCTGELWYSDDTQMTIGVAETLADHGQILAEQLCQAFVKNYVPSRGYGRGARAVLEAMQEGGDYRAIATKYFPGGSYGNGAAMRVAPVGLFFRDDPAQLLEQARLSALPTHLHPLGVEGAQLLALAVAHVSRIDDFERSAFFAALRQHCQSEEYSQKLDQAAKVSSVDELAVLGNGIEALESVPTAIASFALHPHSYVETIGNVILIGGDTDTMAAMAGALSGAFLGCASMPKTLLERLEDSPQGRSYIMYLSDRLFEAYERSLGGRHA